MLFYITLNMNLIWIGPESGLQSGDHSCSSSLSNSPTLSWMPCSLKLCRKYTILVTKNKTFLHGLSWCYCDWKIFVEFFYICSQNWHRIVHTNVEIEIWVRKNAFEIPLLNQPIYGRKWCPICFYQSSYQPQHGMQASHITSIIGKSSILCNYDLYLLKKSKLKTEESQWCIWIYKV